MIEGYDKLGGLYTCLKTCSNDGQYFSVDKILPYNRMYNFMPGMRSASGKSSAMKIYSILDFAINGASFVYTRRDKDETDRTKQDYFSEGCELVSNYLPVKPRIYYNKGVYIFEENGKRIGECGIAIPLSTQGKYKSRALTTTNKIIYDEFIADESEGQRYLGGSGNPDEEYVNMQSLYGTIDREPNNPFANRTHIFCLGNARNYAHNPFFLKFGVYDELERNPNAMIIAPKRDRPMRNWLFIKARGKVSQEQLNKSWLYEMSDDTERTYIFGDSGTDDTKFVVKEPKGGYRTLCNIIIQGQSYIVGRTEGLEAMHAKRGNDPFARTISVDLLGHDGKRDFELIRAWHSVPELALVEHTFNAGTMTFDSVKTKNAFLSYLNYI